MSTFQDLRSLDIQDLSRIAFAPKPVRVATIAFFCLLIVGSCVWFIAIPVHDKYKGEVARELELRSVFIDQQHKAANLNAYRAQLDAMRDELDAMLLQLPNSTQIEALLAEVVRLGGSAGLDIVTFRPVQEMESEFYIEHSIDITVEGTYEQIGHFSGELAQTSRIVNLRHFDIYRRAQTHLDTPDPEANQLRAELRVTTYRYNGSPV